MLRIQPAASARRAAAALLAVGLAAGCAVRPVSFDPASAYEAVGSDASPEALAAARAAFDRDPGAPESGRAAFLLARRSLHDGRPEEIDRTFERLQAARADSEWLPPVAWLRLLASREGEGTLRLLQRVDEALRRFPADPAFTAAARSLLPPALTAASRSDLDTLLAGAGDGPVAPDALLALAKLDRAGGAPDEAVIALRRLVGRFPAAPAAAEAFAMLRELTRDAPVNARVIGAILPLTGRAAPHGLSVRQGVQLALDEQAATGTPFEFVFTDTQEDAQTADASAAVQALQTLARDRQAIAMFGPLFSRIALACAAEANVLGITLLTPAAVSARLTQTSPYVFRAGLSPEQQAAALARYAVRTVGSRRIGTLAPDTAYGRVMSQAFAAALAAEGATLVAESRYPQGAADFNDMIVALGGADVGGYKDADESFRRAAQADLEVFIQRFFEAAATITPTPAPAATVSDPDPGPPAEPAPPLVTCYSLSADPFAAELGRRIQAAVLPVKTMRFALPESASGFSRHLPSADVGGGSGEAAGASELALYDLLGQAAGRDATLSVLVSVEPSSRSDTAETLRCVLSLWDARNQTRLAGHEFRVRRPLPPTGNRQALDAIYLPVPGRQLLQIVPQLVYHGMSVTLFGSDTWDDDELRRRPEGVTLPAWMTVAFWPDLPHPRAAEFTLRYQDRFAAPPDALAAAAYDAARMLMAAVLRSDGTREGLREALADAPELDGLTGPMRMTPAREIARDPVILRLEGGGFVPVR